MATLETVSISRPDAIIKWNRLNTLANNCDFKNDSAWYAATRSHELMKSAVKPLLDIRAKLDKKYFKRDEKTGEFIEVMNPSGRKTNELKDEFTIDQLEKEIEDFENGDPIEVEVYKIKLSSLKTATVTNMITGQPVSIPPAIITDLYDTHIIDDFEESMEKEEAEKEAKYAEIKAAQLNQGLDIPRKK
jgi:hypothetical protein